MNYSDRFIGDPEIRNGQTVVKGTRVTPKTILASLADGATPEEIVKSFPSLTIDV